MKAVSIAARRSALDGATLVVVRGTWALGYALAVFTGVALGLGLLIGLLGLGQAATGG